MKFRDNSKVLDTSPSEFWKYGTRKFRIQLHETTPIEVRGVVETLTKYAQERFIRLDEKCLQRAIQVFNDEMCSYSTLNFIETYENTQPLFDAPHGDLTTFYKDAPASFDAMIELLNFQFHGIHEEVSAFINILYSLVEKAIPKNCMEIVSPASAGKKLFFDPVLSFYINHGTIRNFNRYTSFPLQDTVGRRILVWNEPNYESSAFDTVKTFWVVT
ncbi:hypothetical protein HPB51_028806 [Rhipicephalus microplus]|uniref:Uncharacterized protein n=1 Tax=Rhipicephalus microplus TaxID=6941 RepID=A0A9J6CWU1_RHIMP|nr:hypothetical protein HPB51_028806 [Rhipicephalus microplus]